MHSAVLKGLINALLTPVCVSPCHSAEGMMVPLGKLTRTGVKNPTGYTLNYNEFIVYDTRQIRMKYLVQVAFNFK